MNNLVLVIGVVVLFLVGLVGIVLPVFPGLPLIWGGILLYGWLTGFEKITMGVLVLTGIITLLGSLLDFLAGILGAKVTGASWYGVLGALLGALFGFIIFNVLGLMGGAFVGAFVGEYLKYNKTDRALRAGVGTILGTVLGIILKIFFAFLLLGIFLWNVLQ
jgi:uncharacterized protein YqgC (DUF456 family)